MIVDGVFSRDYAVVQAVVMCASIFFLMMSLIADLAYALLSPKIRQ
jgi:peptide/nickel transport system permease protein